MATDQEIRDAGFKYIPQQKYLLNPFTLPTTDDDSDDGGNGTPSANIGGNPEGFSVYNPDPNRTRNIDQYRPFNYRQANERNLIGSGDSQFDINKYGTGFRSETEAQKFMDMYPDYYRGKQLEGIPGAVSNYMKNSLAGKFLGRIKSGIESLLPVNRRAIYENELLGQGIALDDIGRIVSDGGDYNTAENVMAGYNANKVTAETFQKRRNMINDKMKDPVQKEARLKALDAAEAKMLGTATDRADMVFDAKSLKKNPDYISESAKLDINNMINEDKEEDEGLIDPNTLRYITKKKAAAAAETENAGTTGTDTTTTTDTGIIVPPYVPDGTPGGGAGQGIDISNAGTIRSSDNNFQGDSGPTTQQESDYGYGSDFGFARGGRVYFFDGGRVAVMNGGLVSLL